jgi:signal transduction histidine kinase
MIEPGLFRSAGFRFGLVYAILLTISAAALAMFLWWFTAGLLDRQTASAIRADAQGLIERFDEGGIEGLVGTIEDRLAANVDDDAIYLLVDSSMNRIAGNLDTWPSVVDTPGEWRQFQVRRTGMRSLALVYRYELPGGYHLLVGRDVQVRVQLGNLLTDALIWAVAIVLAMATAGAIIVRSLFRRTVANISATAAAIAAGDFAQRVKVSGRGDEFDQLAEVINDMLDRIGRLMDGVRQVSNAIAHDLRTPITRARARLEEAARNAQSSADLHAAIDRATVDLDGIVAVFQALLRIAEIEAGSRRASFRRVDIVTAVEGVADLYGAVAEEKGVTLAVTHPERLEINGDAALIQQAVANLVDNAVKFSPENGSVSLVAALEGRRIRMTVTDQGPGIPEEDRSRATERFYRGDTARGTPGSGLGLALVQAVAYLHGGVLRLEDAKPGLRAVLDLAPAEDVRGDG